MPIVLSYQDVEMLGALAYQTGRATGQAQANVDTRRLLAQIDAQRDQTALGLQRIEAQERQAGLDRDLRRELFAAEAALQQADLNRRLAFQREQSALDAAQADQEAQARLQQALVESITRHQRDKMLHQQALERIGYAASLRGSRGVSGGPSGGAQIGPAGIPNDQAVEQEIQQFGHLIPFGATQAYDATDAARRRTEAEKTAKSLLMLPTSQLEALLRQRPADPWAPFLRAVMQARKQAGGFGAGGGMAMPEGRTLPLPGAAPRPGTPLSQGVGLGQTDPRLQALSDDELMQLANDPTLLEQYLGGW